MKAEEQKARQNKVCQEYRDISIRLSYLIRHRLRDGWTYHRNPNNSYGITLTKNRITYSIWYFNMGDLTSICIDRRSRKSRGITTDPNLKPILGAANGEGSFNRVLEALEKEGIIRKLT